ncbi:MAG: cytochrome C [Calditrichaeota bacterium]|nr:cytochrome C [Calditrichota bacterium]RQV98394.1 MAG: cytochrome C [Calditrichota bacterium]
MKERDLFTGPRIPSEKFKENKMRYMLPSILLGTAALFLLISIFFPYWQLTLLAPQYPGGLKVELYVNHVEGDVQEIDGLNHYIGMRPLEEAAPLERTLSIVLIVVIALLTLSAIYIHSPIALFLSIPAFGYPLIFLGDLYFWMWNFGTNLDPRAPLSSSVKPFVPPLLGEGKVGQFKTVASWDIGLYLSIIASILIVIGLYYHRKVYKPLMEAHMAQQEEQTN